MTFMWKNIIHVYATIDFFFLKIVLDANILYCCNYLSFLLKRGYIKNRSLSCEFKLLHVARVSESRHRRVRYGTRKILFVPPLSPLRWTRFERFHNRMSGEHGMRDRDIMCVYGGTCRHTSGSTTKHRHAA